MNLEKTETERGYLWKRVTRVRPPFKTNVALSKAAQRQADKLRVTDEEISNALYHGKRWLKSKGFTIVLGFGDVRLEIIRPRGRPIDLVSKIYRTAPMQTLWDHLMNN